jgi:uncharacterized protein
MKIGVISDTHGRIDAWKKAEKIFAGADLIVHAGDVLYHPPRLGYTEGYSIPEMAEALNNSPIPIVIAQGNCDAQVYEELIDIPVQSPYAFTQIDGFRVFVSHGHLLTPEGMIAQARKFHADVLITGHTHLPVLERTNGLILLNPGSPAIPKFEVEGKKIGSVAVISDENIRIVNIEDGSTLFELKR